MKKMITNHSEYEGKKCDRLGWKIQENGSLKRRLVAAKSKEPTRNLRTAVDQNDVSSSPMRIFFALPCQGRHERH